MINDGGGVGTVSFFLSATLPRVVPYYEPNESIKPIEVVTARDQTQQCTIVTEYVMFNVRLVLDTTPI